MYEAIFVMASLFIGAFLAKITKEELSVGKKYFKLLCNLCLGVLIFLILWDNFEYKIFIGIAIGLILGFFIFNPYLYMGILAAMTYSGFNRETFIIISMLFTLSYLSLYHKQANWKFFLLCIFLFLFPYLTLPFKINIPWLLSGIAIGGFFHVIKENYTGD